MFSQNSLFNWSFSVGTYAGCTLRISWLMPLAIVWIWFQQPSWPAALFTAGVLFCMVLLHEIGHVVAARSLGLQSDEILLWPLGGLAAVEPTSNSRIDFLVAAAGPLVNLGFVLGLLPVLIWKHPAWTTLFYPLEISIPAEIVLGELPAVEACGVVFAINWVLLLVNLIPAVPLDGGRMLRALLSARYPAALARELAFRVAIGAGLAISLVAMLFVKSTMLMGLGTFILLGCILEWVHFKLGQREEDSFMGYDFSQGYTSLNRSAPDDEEAPPRSKGMLQRWKEQRETARKLKEDQEQQAAEAQLDALLDKVHQQGLQSLSTGEKRMLDQVSQKYRARSKPAG